MQIDRRALLKTVGAASALAILPRQGAALFAPEPDAWRRFEVVTRIALPEGSGPAQIWVPVPTITEPDWMEALESSWTTTADRAELKTDPENGASFVHASWDEGEGERVLDLTSVVATRDRAKNLSRPGQATSLSEQERAYYTAPTELIPTDGIVLETAEEIVGGTTDDLEKARAIYDWIVEKTARNPETRGCGLGDIGSMLRMGDLTGKCADLNALYVGLARSAGLAARDVYGLRVAPSAFGYKSLGAGSSDVTKAQHCRAEVFVDGHGWIAVDPADVRKVMLEEPPKDLPLDDPKVVAARRALFGGWEGNWIGYNFAHDVALPGSENGPVPFLMYPQAEIADERLDPLDYDNAFYEITATEITG